MMDQIGFADGWGAVGKGKEKLSVPVRVWVWASGEMVVRHRWVKLEEDGLNRKSRLENFILDTLSLK